MDQFKISAKALGALAMPDSCDRCTWIKLKVKNLPFQIFPGIFSTIDAYTKKIVHHWIDGRSNPKSGSITGRTTGKAPNSCRTLKSLAT